MQSILRTSQVVLVANIQPANAGDLIDTGWFSGSGRSPGEGYGNHGERSWVGYSLEGHKELDMT